MGESSIEGGVFHCYVSLPEASTKEHLNTEDRSIRKSIG